jgi:hypothetical protein
MIKFQNFLCVTIYFKPKWELASNLHEARKYNNCLNFLHHEEMNFNVSEELKHCGKRIVSFR